MAQVDRTGNRYGRLVVKEKKKIAGWGVRWVCVCDCGKEVLAAGYNLESGNTTSCGCSRATHRMSKSHIYGLWKSMRQRCENPNDAAYPNYGARGIKVCERWQTFENFLADMPKRPAGTTLDRIDNDGDYEPSNCRWATWREQHDNKRNTKRFTAFGKSQSLVLWAEEYGINIRTLHNRIYRAKLPLEKALRAPIQKGKRT